MCGVLNEQRAERAACSKHGNKRQLTAPGAMGQHDHTREMQGCEVSVSEGGVSGGTMCDRSISEGRLCKDSVSGGSMSKGR